MNNLLQKVAVSLAAYLEKVLPSLFEDWWKQAVLNNLSFEQGRHVEQRNIRSLGALDLAALLRVLDQNWYQISTRLDLPSEARHFVKEMQTVRNRWAHATTEGFPVEDIYRDLDTLQRFAAVIEADDILIQEVRATKTALLAREMRSSGQSNAIDPLPPYIEPLGRAAEQAALRQALADPSVAVISLGGPGGVGKTTLARWLVEQAPSHRAFWLTGDSRRLVSIQHLLSAVEFEAPPEIELHLRDLERFSSEKPGMHFGRPLEAAVEYLGQEPTLLVLDYFHTLESQPGFADFVDTVFRLRGKLKLVLTTRLMPDHADWPAGAYCLLTVPALPGEAFRQHVGLSHPGAEQLLAEADWPVLYEKTSGNPGVVKHGWRLIEQYARGRELAELPIYQEGATDAWINSLLSLLPGEARELARQLSVIRGPLDTDLISSLSPHLPRPKAMELVIQLKELYLLANPEAPEGFVLERLARDYLYARMTDKERHEAHRLAGETYAARAEESVFTRQARNDHLEAIYHFSQGGLQAKVLDLAPDLFEALSGEGDMERAQVVAQAALDASHTLSAKTPEMQQSACEWALRLAEMELYRGVQARNVDAYLEQAHSYLEQAHSALPPEAAAASEAWQGLAARLWLLQGRQHYRQANYPAARKNFEQLTTWAKHNYKPLILAQGLVQLGRVERRLERWPQAKDCFQQALSIAQERPADQLAFDCLSNLGVVERKQGQFGAAIECYSRARDIALRLKDSLALEICLSHGGRLLDQIGRLTEAEVLLREALDLARQIHNTRGVRIELTRLINVLLQLPDSKEAEALFEESNRLNQEADDTIGLAWSDKHRGQVLIGRGEVEKGKALIRQGIEKLRQGGYSEHIPEFEKLLRA